MTIDREPSRKLYRFLCLLAAALVAIPMALVVVPAAAAALIGTADIQNRAVTSAKIARGAVQVENVKKPVVHEVGAPGEVPYTPRLTFEFKAYNGAPFGNLSYYKDASGVVHLTGLSCVASDNDESICTSGQLLGGTFAVFTLPKGFHPRAQQVFTTLSADSPNYLHTRVDVTKGGVVEVVIPPALGEDWISFDGVSFLSR